MLLIPQSDPPSPEESTAEAHEVAEHGVSQAQALQDITALHNPRIGMICLLLALILTILFAFWLWQARPSLAAHADMTSPTSTAITQPDLPPALTQWLSEFVGPYAHRVVNHNPLNLANPPYEHRPIRIEIDRNGTIQTLAIFIVDFDAFNATTHPQWQKQLADQGWQGPVQTRSSTAGSNAKMDYYQRAGDEFVLIHTEPVKGRYHRLMLLHQSLP